MQLKSVTLAAILFLTNGVYAASSQITRSRDALVGTWSTVNYFGQVVNPSGTVVQSLYSGKWFTFNSDGTYEYMRLGSGQYISGVIVAQGTFEVDGSRVTLRRTTESWYPSKGDPSGRPMYKQRRNTQIATVTVEFKGPLEIIVREEDDTVSTFRRDPKGSN